MSYSVTYGDAQTYTSGWRNCRRGGALYLSNSARLTPAIKRAILADVTNDGYADALTVGRVAEEFARLSISKWDNVTVRPMHVTNKDDDEDWRVSVDYSYARGSGELETERVKFLRV